MLQASQNFRRACRQAINNHSKGRFLQTDKLHKARNPKKMWNCIKLTKKQNVNYDAISLKQHENHFLTKFGATGPSTTTVEEADFRVRQKYAPSKSDRKSDNFNFSNFQVVNNYYIKMLKSGSAPGLDGITSEHLKFALQCSLPSYLAVLLTLCFRFGVVPDSFCRGLLVPVMEKANLDPTECKSYRPMTVSSVV